MFNTQGDSASCCIHAQQFGLMAPSPRYLERSGGGVNYDDLPRNEPEVRQAFISVGSTLMWMSENLHQKHPAKL